MNKIKLLPRLLFIFVAISSMLFSTVNTVIATDSTFMNENDIIYYDDADVCPANATGDSGSTGGIAPSGQVKIAQANIKISSPDSTFKTELDKVIATNPDFVSGNEWSSRSDDQIKRSGYDFYRGTNGGEPARKTEGDVAMWKSDRWSKVDAGTVAMTNDSDVTYTTTNDAAKNYDGKRSMVWVTVQDSSGKKVSFTSVHHMVNPNKYGPQTERKALYKLGLERAIVKIKELQGVGPVITAGDFNAQKADNGPWHPRQLLGGIGMESTHDSLPEVKAYVDWIFYTKKDIKPVSHAVPFQLFDHPFLTATLEFQGSETYTGTPSVASPGKCTCEAKSSSSVLLEGSDNQEKAWNYLTGKGLSPEQAAGIMGNIAIESSFYPEASNAGNYTGISQWDTPGRWAALVRWAKEQGLDEWSFDTQIQYTYKEGDDRKDIEGIKKYDDVAHTTWYWGRYFEVAVIGGSTSDTPLTNVQDLGDRTQAAEGFFSKYGDTVGSPSGGSSTSCPSDGSSVNATCSNVDTKPPDDFDIVNFPGTDYKTDKRTLYMVNLANDCLKEIGEPEIVVTQGSYCASGCATDSGTSHDGGGAVDLSIKHLTPWDESHTQTEKLIKVLREVGFAAWYRDEQDDPSWTSNHHIHIVALGAPITGPGALGSPGQVIAYCDGRAGAYDSSAVDRHLQSVGRPIPQWAEKYCTRYPK